MPHPVLNKYDPQLEIIATCDLLSTGALASCVIYSSTLAQLRSHVLSSFAPGKAVPGPPSLDDMTLWIHSLGGTSRLVLLHVLAALRDGHRAVACLARSNTLGGHAAC